MKISLARIYYPVKVLGPGNRVGIWLNGCNRRCDGCISPELREYDESKEISVDDIMQMIKRIDQPIDGFTISGGEPFYNPEALNALVQALVRVCDDILIFTGYTIEELQAMNSEAVNSVLSATAALVDGPYIKERNDNVGLRGSDNQRIWVFKYHERYAGAEYAERAVQNVMFGNAVLSIGIPRSEAPRETEKEENGGMHQGCSAAETVPPQIIASASGEAAETVPPGPIARSSKQMVLLPGESVADSYVIDSVLNRQGKQSTVYVAKKWGKAYIVKVYNNGWHPTNQMQSFLLSVRHPNIARIIETGDHKGSYYEIYEYYSEGTLEDTGALTPSYIHDVIVPSVNEGLRELHKNGIVHCDIKPSNLFYSDDRSRIIVGDCGISGYVNSSGKMIDTIRGTPEYAPRVKALLWSAAMSPAYDYGSFGFVLCRAALGHSFFEGMSVEEIAAAWEKGLEIPKQIDGRLRTLILGLLNDDEEQRWGYEQVKRWCEGEFISSSGRNLSALAKKKQVQIKPLIFGRFDGQTVTVTTLNQLANAIRKYWTQATRVIKRLELIDFIRQFDKELADEVKKFAAYHDSDVAVFKLLMSIADDKLSICFCGKEYKSIDDYVEQLATGRDEIARKFLATGMLIYYLRINENEFDQSQVDKLEKLIRSTGCSDMSAIVTVCFALRGTKSIEVSGKTVNSLSELICVLSELTIKEIDDLLHDDSFIAWMNRLGFEKEMKKMKEDFV